MTPSDAGRWGATALKQVGRSVDGELRFCDVCGASSTRNECKDAVPRVIEIIKNETSGRFGGVLRARSHERGEARG